MCVCVFVCMYVNISQYAIEYIDKSRVVYTFLFFLFL